MSSSTRARGLLETYSPKMAFQPHDSPQATEGDPEPARTCVFCGSSPGARPIYLDAAARVGAALAARGRGVVYGGAKRGLMGAVADSALAGGGEVIGVLPFGLQAMEVAHESLTRLEIVDTLHERKARMAELSNAFLVLPGGHGTLEEFFEVLTWLQLAIHDHPVGVYDLDGYYTHVAQHLDLAVREGFIRPEHRALVRIDGELDRLLDHMDAFQAPARPDWAKRARLE